MDAVTYSNQRVIREVNNRTVPLRVHHKTEPLATEFNIRWTPTLIVLDGDGREHHRTVGYLPPEEFISWLLLGTAKSHFDREELGPALELLDELLTKHSESDSAPEAIYLRGVSRYQLGEDHSDLSAMREAYEQLDAKFPGNEWTKRATVYQRV
ncbi:MAG TPA: thioredoxin fold domain-containing protein [Dehalococcoidia bacterium]|nr:thioredoxin fold domain-containing protein [Dehalococcoidia bacterium]